MTGCGRRASAGGRWKAAAGLVLAALAAGAVPAWAEAPCATEAQALARAEREMPSIEVPPPGDRHLVCLTLAANTGFARRLDAFVARCPDTPPPVDLAFWRARAADYAARARARGCRPTPGGGGP